MSKDIPVNKTFAVITALFAAVFLLAAVSLFLVGSWIGGGVCVLLAAIYVGIASRYGAVVRIEASGISRRALFRPRESYTWDELAEVGVFGTRLFHKAASKKTGTLYLYFSTEAMTEEERFNMVLKWPPKQLYFLFTQRNLELVQYFWDQKIVGFNTGDLRL